MSIEIIGARQYQDFMAEWKECDTPLRGTEVHLFHPTFKKLLDRAVGLSENLIYLDYPESFSNFPSSQGIYFCVRPVEYSHACEIWYVGKAGNLRNRWKNHHKLQALQAIKGVLVYCLPLETYSKEQIGYAERIYIEMLQPVFNDTSKPEKYLRLAS